MGFLSRALVVLTLLFSASSSAQAQSACPSIVTGTVLTAAQWNACFAAKQDSLLYVPLNKAGDSMSGKLALSASNAGSAGLNLSPGVFPSSPQNGDVWMTSTGIYAQINGLTVGPLSASGVTSVGLSLPNIFNISGSPITAAGTLTGTLAAQSASTVLAGPATGSPAAPTFRQLSCADISNAGPGCAGSSGPSAGNPTAIITGTAVNGTAATFMRSDAAPALGVASATVLGGVKPDGTTITNSAGTISTAYGITSNTAAQGNDSRIVGAAPSASPAFTGTVTGPDSGTWSAGGIVSNFVGSLAGNVTGTATNVTGTVAITNGGTGATTGNAALDALIMASGSSNGAISRLANGTYSLALSVCGLINGNATNCAKALGYADPRQFGASCSAPLSGSDDRAGIAAALATGVPVMIPYPGCALASTLQFTANGQTLFSFGAYSQYVVGGPPALTSPYIFVTNALTSSANNCAIDWNGYDNITLHHINMYDNFGAYTGTTAICDSQSNARNSTSAFLNIDGVSISNFGTGIGQPTDASGNSTCAPSTSITVGNSTMQIRGQGLTVSSSCYGMLGNFSDVHLSDVYFDAIANQGYATMGSSSGAIDMANVRCEQTQPFQITFGPNSGGYATATGSGTTYTVNSVIGTGTINPGNYLVGYGIPNNTYVVSQTSGTTGGVGVYVTNQATTAASGATFTGTGAGTNLTASSVTGTIQIGDYLTGTGIPTGTLIISQTSGTTGGAGVYVTSSATTSSGAAITDLNRIRSYTAPQNDSACMYFNGSIYGENVSNLTCDHSWGACVATGTSAKHVSLSNVTAYDSYFGGSVSSSRNLPANACHFLINGGGEVSGTSITTAKNNVSTPYSLCAQGGFETGSNAPLTGTGVPAGTYIVNQVSGAPGGAGVYTTSAAMPTASTAITQSATGATGTGTGSGTTLTISASTTAMASMVKWEATDARSSPAQGGYTTSYTNFSTPPANWKLDLPGLYGAQSHPIAIGSASPSAALALDLTGETTLDVGLPNVASANRQGSPPAGAVHYNTTTTTPEYFNGLTWQNFSNVSVTASSPNLLVTPSPGVSNISLGVTSPLNDQLTATSYAVQSSDMGATITSEATSAMAVSLQAATVTGFTAGNAFSFTNRGTAIDTITPTTSTINGKSSVIINPGESAFIGSDGANYWGFLGKQPEMVMGFEPGSVLPSVLTSKFGFRLMSQSATIDKAVFSAGAFTCTTNPVMTIYDCLTSTTCASGVVIATQTLAAAGTAYTVSPAYTVPAGDYVAAAITDSGACTVLDAGAQVSYHEN